MANSADAFIIACFASADRASEAGRTEEVRRQIMLTSHTDSGHVALVAILDRTG